MPSYVVAMDTKMKHPHMNRMWDTEYLIAREPMGGAQFFWVQATAVAMPNGFTVFTDPADAVAWVLKIEAWLEEGGRTRHRRRYRDKYKVYVKRID